jgi:hypothetical protein
VDGMCTGCGSLKVPPSFETWESASTIASSQPTKLAPVQGETSGELRPYQAVTAGETALISHIKPIIFTEPIPPSAVVECALDALPATRPPERIPLAQVAAVEGPKKRTKKVKPQQGQLF